jgi:hypothetical protein
LDPETGTCWVSVLLLSYTLNVILRFLERYMLQYDGQK